METILITGANKGIGLELVRGFAESGRHVIACCRAPGEAGELKAIAGVNDNVEVLLHPHRKSTERRSSQKRAGFSLNGCIDEFLGKFD